ncbi:hypothetical protein HK101_010099 [Irineochytrium annulatum]|nr:hypothetical protein HK101_010099 [Irineochytrium annulatum]
MYAILELPPAYEAPLSHRQLPAQTKPSPVCDHPIFLRVPKAGYFTLDCTRNVFQDMFANAHDDNGLRVRHHKRNEVHYSLPFRDGSTAGLTPTKTSEVVSKALYLSHVRSFAAGGTTTRPVLLLDVPFPDLFAPLHPYLQTGSIDQLPACPEDQVKVLINADRIGLRQKALDALSHALTGQRSVKGRSTLAASHHLHILAVPTSYLSGFLATCNWTHGDKLGLVLWWSRGLFGSFPVTSELKENVDVFEALNSLDKARREALRINVITVLRLYVDLEGVSAAAAGRMRELMPNAWESIVGGEVLGLEGRKCAAF